MLKIEVKEILHNNTNRYFLFYSYNKTINNILKQFAGTRYSNTYRTWHAEIGNKTIEQLQELLKDHATFDLQHLSVQINVLPTSNLQAPMPIIKQQPKITLHPLDEERGQRINLFKRWLNSRRYASSTIETYCEALKIFLRYYGTTPVEELDNQSLIDFNNDYILANKFSSSFQNQVVNAVKLFFSRIEDKKLAPELVHRPKRPKALPNILSKEEVKALLNAHNNIKHKVMLSLIYSCGLRCGELLRLKPEHIDSKRNLIIIKQAKGRKDRITPLSSKIAAMLREYFIACKPVNYLFEGQTKGEPYDARSLQQVLKQGIEKAGIKKPVSLHWLRHSYATHLLENGTDLRYIQEILGHSSSRTTEIYTHVSTKNIQNITSPFDYL